MTTLPRDPETSGICHTALRWTPDGELSWEDLNGLLARLAAVDGHGQQLRSCALGTRAP